MWGSSRRRGLISFFRRSTRDWRYASVGTTEIMRRKRNLSRVPRRQFKSERPAAQPSMDKRKAIPVPFSPYKRGKWDEVLPPAPDESSTHETATHRTCQ